MTPKKIFLYSFFIILILSTLGTNARSIDHYSFGYIVGVILGKGATSAILALIITLIFVFVHKDKKKK